MPSIKDLPFPKSCEYRSGSKFEPLSFFISTIPCCIQFDILLGYFSSAAISSLSVGFASFIYNGGNMRLIINNTLSPNDKHALIKGKSDDVSLGDFDDSILNNYYRLKSTLDSYGDHFFNCLAYLISKKRLQFVIISPKGKAGISHYKSGLLNDGVNKVKFKSSCNLTHYGLFENLEELEIKRSWGFENELISLEEYEQYFENIFSGQADFVEYLNVEDVSEAIYNDYGNKDQNELLITEKELIQNKKEKFRENKKLMQILSITENKIMEQIATPTFPYPQGPREYQIKAYTKWTENNFHGIFAMATGTGKTLTSLYCVLEEYKKSGIYNVIIVVPTKSLAYQWNDQVKEFNFQNIINTTLNPNWFAEIARLNKRRLLKKFDNFFIITTYATFNREKFYSLYHDIVDKSTLTFIADEAHTLGSSSSLLHLPKEIGKKIGLSATPERIYDDIGSQQLYDFFRSFPPCYTYSYSMKEAIKNDVLCRYNYFPIIVELDVDELEIYNDFSRRLAAFYDSSIGGYKDSAQTLLLLRKQVIHKARNKKVALQRILRGIQAQNERLSYTFIYVPEGFEPDYSILDEYNIEESDIHIIDEYSQILNSFGYKTHQFLGGALKAQNILRLFSQGKLEVLLAMKCLDEGVDIPRTEYAIFCSSTGNPRQFIQRRGRILRNHKDKKIAKIYDLIVVPPFDAVIDKDLRDIKSYELNIFRNELRRVISFLALSENWDDVLNGPIGELCTTFQIDIYELLNEFNSQEETCKD